MNKLTLAMITFASTAALAQGAGSGAAKAPEAKKADAPKTDPKTPPADAAKKAEPPKKMEMPKPPAEVAELFKTVGGNWKCTGNAAMDPTDPTKMTPMNMKMAMKLDASKAWITGALDSGPMKMTMMVTFDTNSKKWYRILTDNTGGSETAWSAGMANNKVVWEGEGRGMGMKPWKARTTEEMVSAKEVKMTGEMSMDGKTWMKSWDSACKK